MTLFAYQKTDRYFVQIAEGLEELGEAELLALGAREVRPVYRGLHFEADRAAFYRINYCSRLAARVLAPLLRFDCHSSKYLYKTARKLNWQQVLAVTDTFAISATVSNSRITHSQYAALCLKDAIVDQFREACGRRPDVDTRQPQVRFHLHLHRNKAEISLDSSGGALHRRGYRVRSVEAPMQETLAAAIIGLSGWEGERPLYDPFCGSGTLVSEALMRSCRIPAGYLRDRFGFTALPDFDTEVWQQVKATADRQIRALPEGLIAASDSSGEALAAARENCRTLPSGDRVRLSRCRFQEIDAIRDSIIVANPPYGLRLGKKEDLGAFLQEFGDFLKQRCTGSVAYLYLGRRELAKKVGLRPAWKRPLPSGGLDGVLLRYDLY